MTIIFVTFVTRQLNLNVILKSIMLDFVLGKYLIACIIQQLKNIFNFLFYLIRDIVFENILNACYLNIFFLNSNKNLKF